MNRRDIESIFSAARKIRALVVGDLMIDEYLWGKAERISPEAPVQVVDVTREDLRLGGAGNVANNLLALGCEVSVCSVTGADLNGTILRKTLVSKGVAVNGLFESSARTTTRKTRVIASNQQIIRIDRESRDQLSPEYEELIIDFMGREMSRFNVVLVSDYQKGVLTDRVLTSLIKVGKSHKIPIVVDPKGKDFSRYRGATVLTPNRKETEQATGVSVDDEKGLVQAAGSILREGQLEALLITRSEQGMSLFRADGEIVNIPTFAREVYDVTGAGDTVLSVMGLGLAAGLDFADAAFLANAAAGIAVGKVGTSTVSPDELIGSISQGQSDTDIKVKNLDVLAAIIQAKKAAGNKVVFTNGCFDLLHAGHVKYLQKARTFGDILVLGLNSDSSVRRLKGEKRPLISQDERTHLLAALSCIDYLVVFDEDTPLRLIEAIRPDVLVKGGDYSLDGVVGRDIVEAYGGRVEIVEFVDGKSTTRIIEKILESYS